MKRVIALSDSHGDTANLRDAVLLARRLGAIDALVFLGDGLSDFEEIQPFLGTVCPEAALYAVRGNNDWRFSAPNGLAFNANGVKFYACHGHEWHVKYGMDRLCYAAREHGAAVALYGHTHRSHLETAYGVTLINPGAVCERTAKKAACAEICVGEDGTLRTDLLRWE